MKKVQCFMWVIFAGANLFAAKVDTANIFSAAMQKSIKCVVIKPDSYKKKKDFPVVYLLHGYDGNYSNWISKVPVLKKFADTYQLMIVCPDGGFSSWYFDSPIDSSQRYETHIVYEVIPYIDSSYKTNPLPPYRAITGLSMGGHGALYLALKHNKTFGAAGSMSGGVDLKESKYRYDIEKRIGDTVNYARNWHDLTVINLVENYSSTKQKIIVDCGVKDIFINGNRRLHQKMLALNILHTYIERDGEHNWDYWGNAVQYQLLFFHNYFITNR